MERTEREDGTVAGAGRPAGGLWILRVAYWAGALLDAVAFVQMAFPAVGMRMLGVDRPLGGDFTFAIELGAGLMLAWTLLLIWADRKPVERRAVLPLTMIIAAWNLATMVYGVGAGVVPLAAMLPQIAIIAALFAWYALACAVGRRLARR